MGHPTRCPSASHLACLLHDRGLTHAEVAYLYGVSPRTVDGWASRLAAGDLPEGGRRVRRPPAPLLKRLVTGTPTHRPYTHADIADLYGVSRRTVDGWARRMPDELFFDENTGHVWEGGDA